MADNEAPISPKMDSTPPAKRTKTEQLLTSKAAREKSLDDPNPDFSKVHDDDDEAPSLTVEEAENSLEDSPEAKQEAVQAIVKELKVDYEELMDKEMWILRLMSCFPFSDELLLMVMNNLVTQLDVSAVSRDPSNATFPDGHDYDDWISNPRQSYLKKEDTVKGKGTRWPSRLFDDFYALMETQHWRSFNEQITMCDDEEEVTQSEYDAAMEIISRLYTECSKGKLICFEMERFRKFIYPKFSNRITEDMYQLEGIRNYIIEESGLENLLEEMAEQVVDGLDPPSEFESINLDGGGDDDDDDDDGYD